MNELDKKYVFHIPLYKYENNDLILLDIDDILNDLIVELGENDFNSLYISKVESYYKTRYFDELLLTLFVESEEFPDEIFKSGFRRNNDVLQQEEFAFECRNRLFVEKL